MPTKLIYYLKKQYNNVWKEKFRDVEENIFPDIVQSLFNAWSSAYGILFNELWIEIQIFNMPDMGMCDEFITYILL